MPAEAARVQPQSRNKWTRRFQTILERKRKSGNKIVNKTFLWDGKRDDGVKASIYLNFKEKKGKGGEAERIAGRANLRAVCRRSFFVVVRNVLPMMAESEKEETVVAGLGEKDGQETFMDGMAVLDFDMLCATVALQTQGKLGKLEQVDGDGAEFGGVQRMWEGQLLDCLEDRRIALETACCPCYRFGKNMRRAGFGSCFVQGLAHFILVVAAFLNYVAFIVTKRQCFLYLAIAFTFSAGIYLGFFRIRIRKKFNIRGSDSFLDDCFSHLLCCCCTLCQESRTLEINNVQDGIWHGRGDTICIGQSGEGSKAFFELRQPSLVPIKSPDLSSMQQVTNGCDHKWVVEVTHSEPLVLQSQ